MGHPVAQNGGVDVRCTVLFVRYASVIRLGIWGVVGD